jgi:hypothetical protein
MKKEQIKQCCASCQYRMVEEDGSRLCTQMEIYVKQQFTCPKWILSKRFRDGPMRKVKRREYLLFVLEVQTLELVTLDSLRERFEKETGLSPFTIR